MGKISGRREWLPTKVFLSGESHGQRSLTSYSLWNLKELGTIERLLLLLPFGTWRRSRKLNDFYRQEEVGDIGGWVEGKVCPRRAPQGPAQIQLPSG